MGVIYSRLSSFTAIRECDENVVLVCINNRVEAPLNSLLHPVVLSSLKLNWESAF